MAAPSGTVWGAAVSDKGRIGINVNQAEASGTVTVTFQVWFWSKYAVSDSTNTLYFTDDSTAATTDRGVKPVATTVSSGTGWDAGNQVLLGTYASTYTEAKTVTCAARLTGVEAVGGDMAATATYTVKCGTSFSPFVAASSTGDSNKTSGGSQFRLYVDIQVTDETATQARISMRRYVTVVSGDFEGAGLVYSGTLGSGTQKIYAAGATYLDSTVDKGWYDRGSTVTHTFAGSYTGGSGTAYKATAECSYAIPEETAQAYVYDGSGKPVGVSLWAAYDSSGNRNVVQAYAYDSSGKPRQIN